MNTYEINQFNEVVPYTSGRRCNDTRAWRDATELELQQKEEIKELNVEVDLLKDQIYDLKRELNEINDNFNKGVYL